MGHAEHFVENGVNPELLLGGKYGDSLHIWDLRKRRHLQSLDLGAEQQIVLELRGARSDEGLRFCRCRDISEGSIQFDLVVASPEWRIERRFEREI